MTRFKRKLLTCSELVHLERYPMERVMHSDRFVYCVVKRSYLQMLCTVDIRCKIAELDDLISI